MRIADLDLQSAVGADMAYARIRRAAKEVCAPAMSHSLALLAASERCETQAIARAVAAVNAPALSRYLRRENQPAVVAGSPISAWRSAGSPRGCPAIGGSSAM